MYIIDTTNDSTVAHITTNRRMTLDEAIALVGEYDNEHAKLGEPEVYIDGEWHYYDDLKLSWSWEEGVAWSIEDVESVAAALYDGGWRAKDRDGLKVEYELTDDEADKICEKLESLEGDNTRME